MDLMTQSVSFTALKRKYRGFTAPALRIKVDGTEIIEKCAAVVQNVEVTLTVESQASGCSFDIMCAYDPSKSAFSKKSAVPLMQLGAKISLELGYIETVEVFSGLVAEVEYIWDQYSAPYVHVECLDAKSLLIKQRRLRLFVGKSADEMIKELIEPPPFSSYISGKSIEKVNEKLEFVSAAAESDFQFITHWTKYMGYEFFIIQGKVYFRKRPASSSAYLTLSPNAGGITSAGLSLRGSGLYEKTVVNGIDPANNKAISGEAKLSGKYSKGQTASKMFSGSVKNVFDPYAVSAQLATERAKVIMREIESSFGIVTCRCIGLPEICPGRTIELKEMGEDLSRKCYVVNVRHTYDDTGFYSAFEARINGL